MLSTIKCASSFPNSNKFSKRLENGRKKFEHNRNASLKNLKDDISKIAKQEVEFSKSLIKQMIPLEISIDKNATGLRKLIPLNISIINDEESNTSNTSSTSDAINETYVNEEQMYADKNNNALLVDLS
jgi:hypothetical protein